MKVNELLEMTMKAGDLSHLKNYFTEFVDDQSSYKHIGDIEHFKVLKKDNIYLLMSGSTGVAFFEVRKVYKSLLLDIIYIDEPFRGKDVLEKFIWFLKKHKGGSKITIGDVHSEKVNAIKKLSKKFEISWVKGNQKIKYDPEKINDFYGTGHTTGWQIMLENDGDFSDWPLFFNEQSPDIKQYYYWLLE